jgi:PKD repeat protein
MGSPHAARPARRRGPLALVAACLLIGLAPARARADLSLVKGPYLQTVTPSSIIVMWQTDTAADATVTYTPAGGSPATVAGPAGVTLHTVTLTGLSSDTAYTYQVASAGAAGSITSVPASFHTAPAGVAPFRFDVYGDSRTFADDHAQVVAGIVASAPRFVLHTGDLATDATVESMLQTEFFDPAEPAMQIAPYYPCLGNHEHNSPLYYQYFAALPQGGGGAKIEWYSFDYGTAHFIILDSNAPFVPGSAQYLWLVNDLQSTTAEWRFVMHHHPVYSSGPDGPHPDLQTYLAPLYEQYHVDIVFTGHDHLYERSFRNGVTYIVSGGGGADLYPPNVHPNPYQVFALSTYQYCSVDIDGLTALVRGCAPDGTVFDSVTLSHVSHPPVAGFTASPVSGPAPLAVQFTDTSTGGPTSWSWSFGDGGAAAAQNPQYTYGAAGSYTVSLTASNTDGSDTETKPDYITALMSPQPPAADFSATPTSGTAPLTVAFADLSTGTPASWQWSFGDGGTAAEPNPSHQYAAVGSYTVALTATNAAGSDTETKPDYVAVHPATLSVDFSGSPRRGKLPLSVAFTGLADGADTWRWRFGDGGSGTGQHPNHGYTGAGRYTVGLSAYNAGASGSRSRERYILVSFRDVPITPEDTDDHWALNEILACVESGIVQGYPDGTYLPGTEVTRDQMAAYIARALAGGDGAVPPGPETATFTDVPVDSWAFRYVEYAYAQDIITGYGHGLFSPRVVVDRSQMAAFIARAMVPLEERPNLPSYTPPSTPSFTDVGKQYWAYKHIEYCHEHGVVQGYEDGRYRPWRAVTRDQMAVYVTRAFQLPL